MEFLPLILYAASIVGGCVIMRRRDRWVALVLAIALGPLGFLIALTLKARCPSCCEYYYPGAKVCPHCGRNTKDGTVTTSAR